MINLELISVIIAAYNVENYIGKCLDSVINQTYTNLEIIIVDDASKDKTQDICMKYQEKDKRIKYIRHGNNYGQAIARNTGLDNATGDYIGFIDSDDYVLPDYYELLYNNLKNANADMSVCDFMNVNEWEEVELEDKKNNVNIYEGDEKYYHFFVDLNIQFVVPWGKIYRKKIFTNLRYIPKNSSNDDANIAHKILAKSGRIVYTNIKAYFYVKRQGSVINSKYDIKRLDVLDGEFDRMIFFKNVIGNERLYDIAVASFWNNLIGNFYRLEKYVPEYQYYKDNIIKKYDGVAEVLTNAKKLEGNEKEYNEDFSKFIDLNIPLEHIYRKAADLSSNINIELIKQEAYVIKASYVFSKENTGVCISRMFFEENIANWMENEGLEITLKSSIKNRKLKISITDINDIKWYSHTILDTEYYTTKIPFKMFQMDGLIKNKQLQSIYLERIKSLVFILESTSKNEYGDIYIKNIKVY